MIKKKKKEKEKEIKKRQKKYLEVIYRKRDVKFYIYIWINESIKVIPNEIRSLENLYIDCIA